jgi:hypothetical protein
LLLATGDATAQIPDVSDNDGLWTGMLLMAQSFEFAETRDPKARSVESKTPFDFCFKATIIRRPYLLTHVLSFILL